MRRTSGFGPARGVAIGVAFASVLAAGACGSTISVRDARPGADGGDQSANAPDVAGNAPQGFADPGDTSATDGGAAGLGTGGSATTGAGGSTTSRPPNRSGSAAVAGSTGITARQVSIGFLIAAGSPGNVVGGGLGYDADTNTQIVNAFVAEANATGGIAGRTVRPVHHYIDNTDQSTGTQTRLQNEACVRMTEDEHVFAVIAMQPLGVNFSYNCYANHRTPLIDASLNGTESATFDALYPWLIAPTYMSLTRMGRALPGALQRQGFLTKKMAVLGYDRPDLVRSAKNLLIPALERLGGEVINEAYLEGTYEGLSSGTASAALQFKQQGVDRVVMWAPGGGALLLFARQAESQDYRPRYGISTFDAPALSQGLINQVGAAGQLTGATGAGFLPGSDLADAQSGPLNPREKHCFDVVRRRAGLSYSTRRQSSAVGVVLAACELTRFLQFTLRGRVGRAVTQAEVGPEVAALGTRYLPVNIPASSYHRHKLDGASRYRFLYFAPDCNCFRYRSDWLPVE